jgi:hypothetical protein
MMAPDLSPHPIRMEIPMEDVCSVDEVCTRIGALYTEVTGHDTPHDSLDMMAVSTEGCGDSLGQHTSLDSLHATSYVLVTIRRPHSSSVGLTASPSDRASYDAAQAGGSMVMPTTQRVGLPRAEGTGPWIEPQQQQQQQQQQPCQLLLHSEGASQGGQGRPRFTL